MKADKGWRTDPARLAAARRYVERRQEKLAEAVTHFEAAYAALRDCPNEASPVFDAVHEGLVAARASAYRLRWHRDFEAKASDTYFGNLAAFGVGEQFLEGDPPRPP